MRLFDNKNQNKWEMSCIMHLNKRLLLFTLMLFFLNFANCYANVNYTGVPVLMYHNFIVGDSYEGATISKYQFETEMQYLYENGYETITPKELLDYMNNKRVLNPRSVLITMDDGYESNYLIAYPILKKYGFKATQFTIVSKIDSTPPMYYSKHCTSQQMKEMSDVFTFQSHTFDLHDVGPGNYPVSLSASTAQVYEDLSLAALTLKSLGYEQYAFSYPFGRSNGRIKSVLKSMGISMAFNINPGRVFQNTNRLMIPRNNVSNTTTLDEFKKIVDPDPLKKYPTKVKKRPPLASDDIPKITPTNNTYEDTKSK